MWPAVSERRWRRRPHSHHLTTNAASSSKISTFSELTSIKLQTVRTSAVFSLLYADDCCRPIVIFCCVFAVTLVITSSTVAATGREIVESQTHDGPAGDLHLITQLLHQRQGEHDVVHDIGVGHLPERMNLQ